jgi:multidrug efflux pump subunit AcrA (membrane-fusion protein)
MQRNCCVNPAFSASGIAVCRRALDPDRRIGFVPASLPKRKDAHADRTQNARSLADHGRGTLAKWLVKEGDEVKSGDILAEIETDKATMEFEAVDEGKIAKILVPEGTDGVKVGAPIAILAAEGEDVSARAPEGRHAPAEAPRPPRRAEGG